VRAQVAALFSIKPSLSLGALLQLESMDTRETALELRERRRLSEKIAMAYVGMFVTLGGGFSPKSTSSEKPRQVSEEQHDYDLALEESSIDNDVVQPTWCWTSRSGWLIIVTPISSTIHSLRTMPQLVLLAV
jgi:hypothetical protein